MLCKIEEEEGGAPLRVTVRYTGMSESTEGTGPWGIEKMTKTGILDPGFGDGPVEYADVQSLSVWCELRGRRKAPIAQLKFGKLSAFLEDFQSVETTSDRLTWTAR